MRNGSTVRRWARELCTLTSTDPDRVVEHALRCLRNATRADHAFGYGVRRVGGIERFTGVSGTGDHEIDRALHGYEGRPLGEMPALDLEGAPVRERTSFLPLSELYTREALARTWVGEAFYEPLRIRDQFRLLVFDGPRFVRWIGAVRRGGLFEGSLRSELRALARPVIAAITLADRLERDRNGDGSAQLVLDPRGHVLYASAAAGGWTSGTRAERLVSLVKELDRGEGDGVTVLDGHELRVVRLDGSGGPSVVYLATITSGRPVHLSPVSSLSSRQREVAELAAAGATVPEVARSLGTSTETVRSHLREAYRRLDVSSRVELVRALEPHAKAG